MFDNFQKFIVVADEKSFTKAANKLHISQPAISQSIKDLEAFLGSKLIIKSRSEFKLTELGDKVYSGFQSIDLNYKSFLAKLKDYSNILKNDFKIGLIDSIASFAASNELFNLENIIQTNNAFNIQVDTSTNLISKILSNQIDLAIIVKPISLKDISKDIILEKFTEEEMCLVINKDVNFTGVDTLSDYLFISYNLGSNSFSQIAAKLNDLKIKIKSSISSSSPEVTLTLLEKSKAFSVLPKNTALSFNSDRLKLHNINLSRELMIAYRFGSYIPKELRNFTEKLSDLLNLEIKKGGN